MKKSRVDHSKFVLAVGGWVGRSTVLSTEGAWLPAPQGKWCIYRTSSGNVKDILGILTRRETGRGPHMLPLKFTRQFAFKETLMLLHLHLLPFLSLSLSFFSFLFPHSFGLPLCSLLHPLPFSGPVCSYSCVLSCSGGRGEWYRMLVEARPPSGSESHSWALSLASFHHCWGCDVPFCWASGMFPSL